MGTPKDKLKAAFGYDFLAEVLHEAVERWTTESPKVGKIVTYVGIGMGVAGSIATLIPGIPVWAIAVSSFAIAFGGKMTKK
jgi:hypothetical protein